MGQSTGERIRKQLFFEEGTRWGPHRENVICTRGLWDAHYGNTYHRKCLGRSHSWEAACAESLRVSLEISLQMSTHGCGSGEMIVGQGSAGRWCPQRHLYFSSRTSWCT